MTETPQQEALRYMRQLGWIDGLGVWTKLPNADDVVQMIALARASQAQPEPPAGWVMVPREPTQAMCEAGKKAESDLVDGPWPDQYGVVPMMAYYRLYRAMLAAAPSEGEKG